MQAKQVEANYCTINTHCEMKSQIVVGAVNPLMV